MAKTLKKKTFIEFLDLYLAQFPPDDEGEPAPQAKTLRSVRKAVTDGKFDCEDVDIYYSIEDDVKKEAIRIAQEEYNLDGDLPEGQTPITDSLCHKISKISIV